MRDVIRRFRPVVVALGAVLLLAGCSEPGKVNVAAIVGGETISVDAVQAQVQQLLASEPAAKQLAEQRKLDLLSRELVGQHVLHELLAETARREGVSVGMRQVADFAKQLGGTEIPAGAPAEQIIPELASRARDSHDVARDRLLATELAKSYLGRVTVTVNAVALPERDEARELADRIIAAPERSRELISGVAGAEARPNIDLELGADSLDSLFLSVPEGSVMVINANTGGQAAGYQVVHVTQRTVAAKAAEGFDPSSVDPAQLAAAGRFITRPTAMELDITVNPRYGEWNNVLLNVVPKTEAAVGDRLLTPRASAS